jgi:hypothetical protein
VLAEPNVNRRALDDWERPSGASDGRRLKIAAKQPCRVLSTGRERLPAGEPEAFDNIASIV